MRHKIIGLLSIVLSTMFFSCSSDSESTPSFNRTITASLDGQTWASSSGGAIANLQTLDPGGDNITVLQIIGAKLDQSSISMQIPVTNLEVGTFTFDSNSFASLNYTTPGAADVYTSLETGGTFTVRITEINSSAGTITGTFSGTIKNTSGDSITVTDGTFTQIPFISSDFYSAGTMTLSRDGGAAFTMDQSASDGKYVMVLQSTGTDQITLFGHNATATQDAGLYVISFPDDVAPGTYDLMATTDLSAGIGTAEGEPEYDLTSGTITITSHNINTVVGTFSYTVNNGSDTVEITNGTFSVTHH